MNRLQLATLSQWAGEQGIVGRKRLQKVVYFLQASGCPLNCQFKLHLYGPYSQDVATVCDDMVTIGLLSETPVSNSVGSQYTYRLTPEANNFLDSAQNHEPIKTKTLETFHCLATSLFERDLWQLELGSTIHFFYCQSDPRDWKEALDQACEFKKVDRSASATKLAMQLAQEVEK